MRRKRPLIRLPCLEIYGSASNLLLTVADSISTSLCSEGWKVDGSCSPSPQPWGFRGCCHDAYTRAEPGVWLLHPLQANLGYYGVSVAIQVGNRRCHTSLGDPVFT